MSWDVAFSRRYEDWSAHMIADIPFYVELARKAGGPLVQLAAGNRRVAVPVAQPIGRPVIGVDSSPAMLEQARSRAAEACVELDLRECDMRELVIDQPAALIYCPFRALQYLPTWADRPRTSSASPRRCDRVTSSLGTPSLSTTGSRRASTASTRTSPSPTRFGTPSATPNRHHARRRRKSSLWWASKNEWLGLLDVDGIEWEALYGGFAGEPFDEDSREYVFVARR